ncbi:MAG: hypothetical protein ACI81A_002529, partial [Paraglaciecola sp.]
MVLNFAGQPSALLYGPLSIELHRYVRPAYQV